VCASKILKRVSVRCLDEFGVVPRDVLIIQYDVRITLSSYEDLAGDKRKNIFLTVWSDPI
jgi:hypothetical protein